MDWPDADALVVFAVVEAAVDLPGVVAPEVAADLRAFADCPDAPAEEVVADLMAVPGRGAFVQRQVCLQSIIVKPCSLYMYGIV